MFPWNETLSAELDCSLLNAQSWNKIKQIKHIVVRWSTMCNDWYKQLQTRLFPNLEFKKKEKKKKKTAKYWTIILWELNENTPFSEISATMYVLTSWYSKYCK